MGDNADHASLCINAGCMPSKALFEPIDAMHHARRHGWLTVEPRRPDEYLAQIVRWKDREIAAFQDYRETEIRNLASDKFQIIRANACFINAHELESGGKRYTFDAAIIASGSVTTVPRIEGLDLAWDGLWTSDEILHNTRIPQSLAVIGAGAIGIEFSLRYARLGCKVTLLSKSPLLHRYPQIFGERLAFIYQKEGVRVLIANKVVRIARGRDDFFEMEVEGAAGSETIKSEKVLLATGRRPAVDHLGLRPRVFRSTLRADSKSTTTCALSVKATFSRPAMSRVNAWLFTMLTSKRASQRKTLSPMATAAGQNDRTFRLFSQIPSLPLPE